MADRSLVITEATSSVATVISTPLCAAWGWALGCFSPLGGTFELHNVAYIEQSDWKTKVTIPPAAALWGVLLCASGWEMNRGIFLPALTLGALTTLFSKEEGSAQGPLQLQMIHTGRDTSVRFKGTESSRSVSF